MAETLNLLRQKRDAAEAAALAADLEAGQGVAGATVRAERLHREAQFYSAKIARLEADPAELLKALYLERDAIRAAGRAAEAAADADPIEALADKLARLDRRINTLENPHGTVQ